MPNLLPNNFKEELFVYQILVLSEVLTHAHLFFLLKFVL